MWILVCAVIILIIISLVNSAVSRKRVERAADEASHYYGHELVRKAVSVLEKRLLYQGKVMEGIIDSRNHIKPKFTDVSIVLGVKIDKEVIEVCDSLSQGFGDKVVFSFGERIKLSEEGYNTIVKDEQMALSFAIRDVFVNSLKKYGNSLQVKCVDSYREINLYESEPKVSIGTTFYLSVPGIGLKTLK